MMPGSLCLHTAPPPSVERTVLGLNGKFINPLKASKSVIGVS